MPETKRPARREAHAGLTPAARKRTAQTSTARTRPAQERAAQKRAAQERAAQERASRRRAARERRQRAGTTAGQGAPPGPTYPGPIPQPIPIPQPMPPPSPGQGLVALPGSAPELLTTLLSGARATGLVDPKTSIEVSVYVRRDPSSPKSVQQLLQELLAQPIRQRRFLSREEFQSGYGANAQDLAKIKAFAEQSGLSVIGIDPARRVVELSGTVGAMSSAFHVQLTNYEHVFGTFSALSGPVYMPADLAEITRGVEGLDNRVQAVTHYHRLGELSGEARPFTAGVSYTPPQVAQLYNFPDNFPAANGAGQCIGILEFGGGYSLTDLQNYFQKIGVPMPPISSVSVGHAQNRPTRNPNGPDAEVMLDVEVAGSIASGAKIVVYFAPNTSMGFVNAITTAVHDTTNRPNIISISWGGPEPTWTKQTMNLMDRAFQDAATLGISVFAAAGDSGSSDGMRRGNHVDFPASSPHVTGCGGTQLESSAGVISAEDVWNAPNHGATGGGVSAHFSKPSWQHGVKVPTTHRGFAGRGVPDVAGDASPLTGYLTLVDGTEGVIGGTSAVAPLWAALTALINQQLGTPVGFLNSKFYSLSAASGAFRDITTGNNGAFQAAAGWDPCTGWGSPNGFNLAKVL
jgi:kumamolisin